MEYTFQDDIKYGQTLLQPPLPSGEHNVTIMGWNLCSNVTEKFQFFIESPLEIPASVAYLEYGQVEQYIEISQGESVIFNVTMKDGTSLSITWDWKDGTPMEKYQLANGEAWPYNGYQARSHQFDVPGCYIVEVIIENHFTSYTFPHDICVFNDPSGFSLTSNSPVTYLNLEGPADLYFESATGYSLTRGKAAFHYGDVYEDIPTVSEEKDFNLGPGNYPFTYRETGT